jgi:CheY-like chemotaxis protein
VILYVDDDEEDQQFFSVAVHQVSPETEIVQARNGLDALNYLSTDVKLPNLIVLDLNMPVLDGRETFERIKGNPALRHIPTVIFTSSLNPNDKSLFNSLGAEFISKPSDFNALSLIAHRMLGFCA